MFGLDLPTLIGIALTVLGVFGLRMYVKGRSDKESEIVQKTWETRDEMDKAANDARSDGARKRLRDGSF